LSAPGNDEDLQHDCSSQGHLNGCAEPPGAPYGASAFGRATPRAAIVGKPVAAADTTGVGRAARMSASIPKQIGGEDSPRNRFAKAWRQMSVQVVSSLSVIRRRQEIFRAKMRIRFAESFEIPI
jgi:hypothetical protein